MADDPIDRSHQQISETFAVLEADRAVRSTPHWFGEALTHADIALACAFRFTSEAHPSVFDLSVFPRLLSHAARCEALPEFRDIYLPITNNL